MDSRLVNAVIPIVDAFEHLGVAYELGGSVASSIHGVPRSSLDVDILAALKAAQASHFVREVEKTYYVSLGRVSAAIERESSFNVIHLDTMFKVDIFVVRSNEFQRSSLRRRMLEGLTEDRKFYVTTAEDIVLHKLGWYRKGGEVSERQWQDVVGVLKVQGANLDTKYLEDWAAKLRVSDLLQRATSDAAAGG